MQLEAIIAEALRLERVLLELPAIEPRLLLHRAVERRVRQLVRARRGGDREGAKRARRGRVRAHGSWATGYWGRCGRR